MASDCQVPVFAASSGLHSVGREGLPVAFWPLCPSVPVPFMELLRDAVEFVLHLDTHLGALAQQFGGWTYALVGLTVFCETGLVVTPFLPGDSLLFATGATIASIPETGLNVHLMAVVIFAAAFLGDAANYAIGQFFGERVAARFIKAVHLERTRAFYDRHGGKTIVMARFLPIVRTLAPFVAGMGAMNYRRFLIYNVVGAFAWTTLFLYGGYLFGNVPFVQDNFSLVILGVIGVSVVPVAVEFLRARLQGRQTTGAEGKVPAVAGTRVGARTGARTEAETEQGEQRGGV